MTMNSLPNYLQLLEPVVRALRELGGSAGNARLVEKVAEMLGIPDELAAHPHGDGPQTELSYRVAWAKTLLKQNGALDNPQRGVWVLTSFGRSATKEEIEARVNEAQKGDRNKRASERAEATRTRDEGDSTAEEGDETEDDRWQSELLNAILGMEASSFERLVRVLLLRIGFSEVDVTRRGGDGGIDLHGILKTNELLSFHVLVQCKRWKGTVGPGEIRDFRGAMQGRTDKGVFITSGLYTREAKREATRDGAPPIDLIDGEALVELLKEKRMGVDVEMVEKVTVHRNYFSDF